jgi:cell division protein FtsI/penicillin-binding protein 2
MVDRNFKEGKTTYVGYNADGKPVPRLYKGGMIPRTIGNNVGKLDILRAMEISSNPYFALLAGDVLDDPEDLANAARAFSYGSKTGIDLPAEIPGRIPTDLRVNRTGLYATAIGQHTLVVTPLQTAVMLSTIANRGKVLKPQILNDSDIRPEIIRTLPMPVQLQKILIEGMRRVVIKTYQASLLTLSKIYHDYPEAISDYIDLKEELQGKTSTSESIEQIDLDAVQGINLYNHVWFGGISYSKNEPELVVVVYLRFGGYGKEAAPVAAQMVNKWREINER